MKVCANAQESKMQQSHHLHRATLMKCNTFAKLSAIAVSALFCHKQTERLNCTHTSICIGICIYLYIDVHTFVFKHNRAKYRRISI